MHTRSALGIKGDQSFGDMEVKQSSRLLVLPQDRSPDARIITLAHPRTSEPSRYLFDPHKGLYEFTRIAAPKAACRSWLIGSSKNRGMDDCSNPAATKRQQQVEHNESTIAPGHVSDDNEELSARLLSDGYVMKKAEMLVATPIDLLFLVLPALCDQSLTKGASKQPFLSMDDHLDKISGISKHFEHLLSHEQTIKAIEASMQTVCDSVDAGDEKMYRLSEPKLFDELVSKASKTIESGLPASMEHKFVKRPLEIPVISIKREESTRSVAYLAQGGTPPSEALSLDSQVSTASSTSANSAASNDTDITAPEEVPTQNLHDLQRLLRLRTALIYIISSYVPTRLAAMLTKIIMSEQCPVNFKPLDERLDEIARTRAEALVARSIGDFSRKRNVYEDDDAAESRAEKKRKQEKEEKEKKLEPRGIRDLKKVDTKGMKKMSDFFGKEAATKKK